MSDPRVLYVDHGGIGATIEAAVALAGGVAVAATDGVDALKRLDYEAVELVVVPAELPDLPLDVFVGRATSDVVGPPIVIGEVDRVSAPMIQLSADVSDERLAERIGRVLRDRELGDEFDRYERLKGALLDVTGAALDVRDPDGLGRVVYDALDGTGAYRFVRVGWYDTDDDVVEFEWPTRRRSPVEALDFGTDDPFVSRSIDAAAVTTAAEPVDARSGDGGRLVLTSVPLTGERTRGVVVLGSDTADAPDGTERAVLSRLGRLVGLAFERGARDDGTAGTRFEALVHQLAHELQDPMQIASLSIEVARAEDDPDQLERALSALETMASVLETVRGLWTGGELTGTEPTDVHELVVDVWRDVRTGSAELTIGEPVSVEADPALLSHLLSSLLRHAIQHAGPGVSVKVGKLPGVTGFYVEDDGPGIPPAERTDVFEWGQPADGGHLGLVREIVEAHGWDVSVTEGTEGGARFEVSADRGGRPRDELEALFAEESPGFVFADTSAAE